MSKAEIRVNFHDDPASALREANEFLVSRPVLHNLILTLLKVRIGRPEPGRYWVAARGNQAVGVVFHSPLTVAATLTPMERSATEALVDSIVDAGLALPGVHAEAATAVCFAGRWTERCKASAVPVGGMRLYELEQLTDIRSVDGKFRNATADERNLMIAWVNAFNAETNSQGRNPEVFVDSMLPAGNLWLWDDGEPMSMAVNWESVQGVIRVSGVYTPPQNRGHGYASACVHGVSKWITDAGCHPILYTDLSNATSNSIYRRMGYKAIAEAIRYRFQPPD